MGRNTKYFMLLSLLAVAAFVAAALASVRATDWPFPTGGSFNAVQNLSGPLGSLVAYGAMTLVGRFFSWALPVLLLLAAAGVVVNRQKYFLKLTSKLVVIVLLANVFFALIPLTARSPLVAGAAGRTIGGFLAAFLGQIGSSILVITALLLLLLGYARHPERVWRAAASVALRAGPAVMGIAGALRNRWLAWRVQRRRIDEAVVAEAHKAPPRGEAYGRVSGAAKDTPWLDIDPASDEGPVRGAVAKPDITAVPVRPPARRARPAVARGRSTPGASLDAAELPPLSLLRTGGGEGSSFSADQLRGWSQILESKLSNYGISGTVTAVNQGPLVTTFELEPAPGVKIKDIVSRADDLALAMRARSLRLIAPIPGRAVVGIEIPNPEPGTVLFHDVLSEIPERLRYSGIMIAVGVDAVGKPFWVNLCSAPHLLMAGTTGSGKSVALNCFLASILFQYRPSDVRLLLIDPKMVEMTVYNGIPHLLHPVINDSRDAVKVFDYAIREMERRNQLLHENNVKNIESYNSKLAMGKIESEEPAEKLPYIVLVVDELADLVLTKGADFESLLSRLSNMARAVGIHMIVATQRPSVDVIDGKTKANFPTRIAFRVATKVDSRTILDCMGAEKLVGRGDMLYVDAKHPEPLRLHGAWMSEDELEMLVDHWKQYDFEQHHLELYDQPSGAVSEAEKDGYFDDAKEIILQYRQGSTSLLQRKLHVGYARAARLLDQLEQAGVVGPPDGSKPREVLIRAEDENAPNPLDR